MLKKSMLSVCAFLLFTGVAMADFIDHPQYAKITTFTASVVQTIKTYQDQFFVTHGKYFQGLWLLGPDALPDGTTDESVINTSNPSDQEYTWYDFAPTVFKKQLTIPVNIKIDVYQSPMGWGWIFVAEVYIDGLGPDAYGNDGNHWKYIHTEGYEFSGGIRDEWFIESDL